MRDSLLKGFGNISENIVKTNLSNAYVLDGVIMTNILFYKMFTLDREHCYELYSLLYNMA
jgi:hypothetical protein